MSDHDPLASLRPKPLDLSRETGVMRVREELDRIAPLDGDHGFVLLVVDPDMMVSVLGQVDHVQLHNIAGAIALMLQTAAENVGDDTLASRARMAAICFGVKNPTSTGGMQMTGRNNGG